MHLTFGESTEWCFILNPFFHTITIWMIIVQWFPTCVFNLVCMRFPAFLHPPFPNTSGTFWMRQMKWTAFTMWLFRLLIAHFLLTSTSCPWGLSFSGNCSCPSTVGLMRNLKRKWGRPKILWAAIYSFWKKCHQTCWNTPCTSSTQIPVSCWCTGPGRESQAPWRVKTR